MNAVWLSVLLWWGWIWTKHFVLIDHHCSGMCSILVVKSLLIQVIIVSANLDKCTRLNVSE